MKLPSFHDDYLVRYEVDCDARCIVVVIRNAKTNKLSSVAFSGVEGYSFINDAFGSIISDIELVPASEILSDFKAQIAESFRTSGAPGPWAANPDTAATQFNATGVQGFVLSSSYGMSGWILAKHAEAQQTIPADRPKTGSG